MNSKSTKLKKIMTNNMQFKILALILAAVIWLAVVNLSDPNKTVTIKNIPITLINTEAITEQGKVFSVDEKINVDITISGKRSIVQDLEADDFQAIASLDQLSVINTAQIEVDAKSRSIESKITMSKQSVQAITVDVEDITSKEFDIDVDLQRNVAEGYSVGNIEYKNKRVEIKAPKSVLKKINKVIATIDLEDAYEDISGTYKLRLYDVNGNIIKNNNIEKSIKKIMVSVQILKGKEVPIKLNTYGSPAEGYEVDQITASLEDVAVVGQQSEINKISSISIPAEDISIEGADKDVVKIVDLKDYLPDGITLLNNDNAEIEVTVKISKHKSVDYKVRTSAIEVKSLSDKYKASFNDSIITVSLIGEKSVLDSISSSDITAKVSLKGLGKGTHQVEVKLEVPKGTKLVEKVKTKIEIK